MSQTGRKTIYAAASLAITAFLLIWLLGELDRRNLGADPPTAADPVIDADGARADPVPDRPSIVAADEDAPVGGAESAAASDDNAEGAAAAPAAEIEAAGNAAPEAEPATEPAVAPELDIVRIDREGGALVAGRAAADSDVDIVIEDEVVATARAGPDGAFVALFQAPSSPDVGAIRARAAAEDEGGEAPALESEPVFVLPGAAEEAPVVVKPSDEGVKVVQPSVRPAGAPVSLDAISYDEAGRVTFGGRAVGGAGIRIYLDNRLEAETSAAADGSWSTQAAAPIASGVYALRVDEISPGGDVLSRVETPFQREKLDGAPLEPGAITVQAGDSLWRIAEGRYGEGERYTLIYQANAADIRDPDLIYPGQIFALPDAN